MIADSGQKARRLEEALLALDRLAVQRILTESGESGAPIEFLDRIVVPALERLGEGWESGKLALAQIYMGSRILEEAVSSVLPQGGLQRNGQPRLAIAILRDYHALGKRIVTSALRASSFELTDYGRMDVDELAARTINDGIDILLISTLMLPSALAVRQVKDRLDKSGNRVMIAVGGAPFRLDKQLWKEVGADAMGSNASEAIVIVTELAGRIS
ncbi:MAG: cobalamin B12-binding domain-containing protein [Chloroflexi bacterium]|nr:cobalamin B12-binding domain-containing protein [Chloroflexota bacterium]